ncbi:hypothetical protein FRC03_004488 [Tulasnella sp. 419]|nr:hypothetical protein FRC02_011762 [Tulasnella sp. 418]KAG8962223.1 hypothetical protein FRC03_004488 [Tulasnella sp. 419]
MVSLDYSTLYSKSSRLPPPPCFEPSSSTPVKTRPATDGPLPQLKSHQALKEKRAWDLAFSPAKSLPMNAFMLYMSGGGVQIFSMGIVAMLLMSPFKAIASMNSTFAPFAPSGVPSKATSTLLLQKLAFIACNLLTLGLGLYKCKSMGLLPTGSGDWLAFETRGVAPEISL